MLARNFTFKVSSQLLAALMAFASMMVMSRYVANEYGVMMWGLALVSLVNTVADLGFNSANLKFIAKEGYDRQACFSTFMVVKLVLTAIMILITLVTLFVMKASGSISEEAVIVCLIFIIYQVISNFQFSVYYTLDGLQMSGKSSYLTIIECSIRNIALVVMAFAYVDAITLSSAYVIGTAVSGAVSLIMVWKEGFRPVKPIYLKEYTTFAMPLAAALILTSVVTNLDKVILGLSYESIEVTYYSTAVGLIASFTSVGISLNTVLLPHLSHTMEDSKHTEKTIWGLERIMCILLLPFVAFFIAYGKEIAAVLFGAHMAPSGNEISVLAIYIMPFIFAGIMTQILYVANKGNAYLRASVVLCVTAVIGFLLLIPDTGILPFDFSYGGNGAAVSVVAAYTLFFLVLAYMVKRYTGFRIYPKIWKIAVAFAITLTLLYCLDFFVGVHGLIMLAIGGIMGEVVFLALLILMRELKAKHVLNIWKKLRDDKD
ncbi:MAG: oligosaccharide flippase family protein [Candidatus Methanomethylophilaceae archaeon]|nr:oligosaccharide flippase family protein [Candidatus Methanomethylophilaceae archaeon]